MLIKAIRQLHGFEQWVGVVGSLGVKRKKILEGQRDRQGPDGRLARGGADGDWLRGGVGWVMGKPQCCSSFFLQGLSRWRDGDGLPSG